MKIFLKNTQTYKVIKLILKTYTIFRKKIQTATSPLM